MRNWNTRGVGMNWNHKVWPLIFAVMIGIVIPVFATDDCGPCEDANDPSLVAAGAPPCIPKPGHGLKCGEPGEVERIPDVNYPIPDCGECPEVVESVTLGKLRSFARKSSLPFS